jgi:YVTN family beta-propeller protein
VSGLRYPYVQNSTAVASIDVGVVPEFMTLDVANGYVYVSNYDSNNVSVINGTRLIGTVAVGSAPRIGAYDAGDGYVYVTNSGSDTVSVIDGTQVVATVYVGSQPVAATYDDGNGGVYVVNSGGPYSVSVIQGTAVTGTVGVAGPGEPWYTTYDPGNGYVYVTDEAEPGGVTVINGTRLQESIGVGNEPYSETYDGGNGYLYVPNANEGGGDSNVSVIHGLKAVGSVGVRTEPVYATYDPGNGYVYVSNYGSDVVSVINGTTLVRSLAVGTEPLFSTYDSADGYVYVPNYGSGNVTVLNGTWVAGSVDVGIEPYFSMYDKRNGYVYVTNEGSDTVSAIPTWPTVTFAESGLPSGTEWWVNITGHASAFSSNATLSLALPDGTYAYSVATSNKTYSSPGGSLTVSGVAVSETVSFSQVTYPVSFTETGLPGGTAWSVNLSESRHASTSSTVVFAEPNRTCPFVVGAVAGYRATPSNGSLVVSGSARTVAIGFQLRLYPVSFVRHGQGGPPHWTVTLDGVSNSSSGSTVGFADPNGTGYVFEITWPVGCYAPLEPANGTLNVSGMPVTESIRTGPPPPCPPPPVRVFEVTFTESGLPPGTTWSVTFNSNAKNGTGDISFPETPNGTYNFTVGSLVNPGFGGYLPTPATGFLSVKGQPASESIVFTLASSGPPPPPRPTFLGLPTMEGYAVLGGIIAAFAAIAGLGVLMRRRRKAPPAPAGRPADPPSSR